MTKKEDILRIVAAKPYLTIEEIADKVDRDSQYIRIVLSLNRIDLRNLRKYYGRAADYKLNLYPDAADPIWAVIAENPFLNSEELAERANTSIGHMRYLLNEHDLTLTELRRKFGEKSECRIDLEVYKHHNSIAMLTRLLFCRSFPGYIPLIF